MCRRLRNGPNALSQFLFLDSEETFRRNILILSCEISQLLLSEFSKVRKEKPSRYVFIIADYRNGFRLRAFAGAEDLDALQKQSFAFEPGTITYALGQKAELNQRLNLLNSEDFDPRALLDRVHGDLNLLRELVDLFAAEVPGTLARIEKAIQQGSASELEKASHKIKGSMLQFSAHAAANIALQLEDSGQTGSMDGTGMLLEKLTQEIDVLYQTLRAMLQNRVSR
jgi:HPt (histidine-containing phosphotransfer) domain-containing protein